MNYQKGQVNIAAIIITIIALAVIVAVVATQKKAPAPATEEPIVTEEEIPAVEEPEFLTEEKVTPPEPESSIFSLPPLLQFLGSSCLPTDPPSITVISPNGGEVYQAVDSILVTWTSCNIATSQEVFVYAIRPGPGFAVDESPSFMVTPLSLNDGQETIDIPVGFVPNGNGVYDDEFKMYVGANVVTDPANYPGPGTWQNYQDLSDAVFNILP